MGIKNKFSGVIVMILLLTYHALFAQGGGTKVACIGNSVTYGYGLQNREQENYPAQLQGLLGGKFEVRNFGHSGATLLKQGHNPYYKTPEFLSALAFKPDIVIIHLGLNDTDPRDWPNYKQSFEADYAWLIDTLRSHNPTVKVYICLLSPIFSGHPRFKSGTREWYEQIQKLIPRVAQANKTGLIDFHEPLYHMPDLFPDNLHPVKEGAMILAQTAYRRITGDFGGLKLPEIFADDMVLQRKRPVPVYGTANAGDRITVSFRNKKYVAITNEYGEWHVRLPAMDEGGPFQMYIGDKDSLVVLKNILIGDVWLCAGQSNMFFPLKKSTGGPYEIKHAGVQSNLHLYKLSPHAETDSVVWDSTTLVKANQLKFFSGSWKECDASSAGNFSAVAYFFGKKITSETHVPIGLIEIAVGGSPAESWIDRYTMENDDGLVDMLSTWRKSDYVMQWCRDRADVNLKKAVNPKQRHTYEPCYNYEAAVQPLTRFPVKGVIWYQGESNAQNIELYKHLFTAMITSWRQKWGYNIPFYYVQLSGINRPSWPAFRDAQRKLQEQIPNTAMAVSFDMGDSLNVHYPNKEVVGERLARLAMHYTYKLNIAADGPRPTNALLAGNRIIVSFLFARQLKTANNMPLRGFELINVKGQEITPKASIKNNKVLLLVPAGEKISAIHYAMEPFTRANLINGAGLPASTFTMQINNKGNFFY
ncbi:MAG: GDSL-type esterase/lipase family protein [Mucilaginibacter sp.]